MNHQFFKILLFFLLCSCNRNNETNSKPTIPEDFQIHQEFLLKYNPNNLSANNLYHLGIDTNLVYIKNEINFYENLEKSRTFLATLDSTLYNEDRTYLDFTLLNSSYSNTSNLKYVYLDFKNHKLYRILDNKPTTLIDTIDLVPITVREEYDLFKKYSIYRSHLKNTLGNSAHSTKGVFTFNLSLEKDIFYRYSLLYNSTFSEHDFFHKLDFDIDKMKQKS